MGCRATKISDKSNEEAEEELDARIGAAISELAKKERRLKGFNQCILKFPSIRAAFQSIKFVFDKFDGDNNGSIDREELMEAMRALGGDCSEHDLETIFRGSDMTHAGTLGFKQFLLCLALASVLDIFPTLHIGDEASSASARTGTPTEGKAGASADETKSSGTEEHKSEASPGETTPAGQDSILSKGRKMVDALSFVVETYILFDNDGSGYIDRDEVMAMVKEVPGKGTRATDNKSSALLSESRWAEMDWDNDGRITFKEFLSAMFEWVRAGDTDDE